MCKVLRVCEDEQRDGLAHQAQEEGPLGRDLVEQGDGEEAAHRGSQVRHGAERADLESAHLEVALEPGGDSRDDSLVAAGQDEGDQQKRERHLALALKLPASVPRMLSIGLTRAVLAQIAATVCFVD